MVMPVAEEVVLEELAVQYQEDQEDHQVTEQAEVTAVAEVTVQVLPAVTHIVVTVVAVVQEDTQVLAVLVQQ
jgi:hypothetical protein